MTMIAFVLGGIALFGSILWYSLVRSEEKWELRNRINTLEEHVALLYADLKKRVRFVPSHKEVVSIEPLFRAYGNVSDSLRRTTPKSTKKRA